MIEGLAQLQRRWSRIPVAMRAAARDAMEEGAKELVAEMVSRVPIDEGDLAASIGWTWGDAPAGSLVLTTMSSGRERGSMRITIYAGDRDAFYARFVEFGTVNSRARPFFFPTYRALRRRIRSRITRRINKAIKEAR